MSLRAPKRDDSVYGYYISERTPSPYPKPHPLSRSTSSTLSSPSSRALVRTRTGELRSERRPKLTSQTSGSFSSHHSGSTILVSTPGAAAAQHSNNNPTTKTASDCCKQMAQSSEDEEDGSIVLVRVPARNVINATASPSTADLAKMPTAELVRTVGRALSADDNARAAEVGEERVWHSGTALGGLTEAMKLESQLLLLKRELHLYQAFDEASGDIFRRSVHDDFFLNINQIMLDIVAVAAPLNEWAERRRNYDQAPYVSKHLKSAHFAVRAWNAFYDWLLGISNKSIRFQQEEGRVSMVTWERRRRECMGTVDKLLRLLGDVEMDEGARGVLDMQNGLRKQWKADGMVGSREAERMGWIWGIRI